MANALIIDRTPSHVLPYAQAGRQIGYVVDVISECEAARRAVERRRPDVIVIGRLSDDVFRNDLCGQLRRIAPAGQCMIIVLVPGSAQLTRIRCLEEGADGVVDHDIAPGLLWSRIASLFPTRKIPLQERRLVYGKIEMDVAGYKVFASGLPLTLNRTSFSILRLFLENAERVLSRHEIGQVLGRSGLRQDRTIDVHIRNLRMAMKPGGADHLVVTVPQAGYMLCDRAACYCPILAPIDGSCAVAL
jgi:two-component system phosphate regulon response regulator PhoB